MKILQIYFKNKVPSSNDINPSQGPPCFTLILSDFINTLTYNAKIGGEVHLKSLHDIQTYN